MTLKNKMNTKTMFGVINTLTVTANALELNDFNCLLKSAGL